MDAAKHAVKDAVAWLEEQQRNWETETLGTELLTALRELRNPLQSWEVIGAHQDESQASEIAKKELQSLHQLCWTKLHGSSTRVLAPWREVFALCCFMRSELLCLPGDQDQLEALRLLDLGLILGGPETQMAPELHRKAELLAEDLSRRKKRSYQQGPCEDAGVATMLTSSNMAEAAIVPLVPCVSVEKLSMETFVVSCFSTKLAVKVRQGCQSWPAIRRWCHETFWSQSALGQRFVPVETDYWMEEGFNVMQLKDFIAQCQVSSTSKNPSKGGYLAQHALLDQLPILEADVLTPDLALCGSTGTVLRQAFFGPQGTVTPLHWDPYENIFCQVVGKKYLRLYPPSESEKLYPRDKDLMNNSRIDPPDVLEGATSIYEETFPDFLKAKFQDVVLEPGDLLYLPMGWWHFVKSCSVSISVAFHFT